MVVHTILFVKDQQKSRDFYSAALSLVPQLDVPGMVEFKLSEGHILGLMPEEGIKKILNRQNSDSNNASLRAELYFRVNHPETYFEKALSLGAQGLSPVQERNWGARAGYVMDHDGYILAFSN
jgi:catechol 2,3-dioxygenase-like lactoylglutathione lyase family enzyme